MSEMTTHQAFADVQVDRKRLELKTERKGEDEVRRMARIAGREPTDEELAAGRTLGHLLQDVEIARY